MSKKVKSEFKDPPVRSWTIDSIDDCHTSINPDPRKQFTDLTGPGIGSSPNLDRNPMIESAATKYKFVKKNK